MSDYLHPLRTGGERGYLRIATEEAFATREQVDVFLRMIRDGTADKGMVSLWGFYAQSPSPRATEIMERLVDLGERRIADMDATGIDVAILALTSPGVQPILDVEEAKGVARRSNELLADACAKYPTRFVGMTAVAPQDPEWSADEIRRGAREWGFKGCQINSHTQGHYLDEPQFDPIFRALVEVDQPLYIHPATLPDSMIGPVLEAGLGWTGRSSALGWKRGCICCVSSPPAFLTVIPRCKSWWAIWERRCPTGSIVWITCIRRACGQSGMNA